MWQDPVRTAQSTPRLGYKSSQLMLCREIIAVRSEIHTKHINTYTVWAERTVFERLTSRHSHLPRAADIQRKLMLQCRLSRAEPTEGRDVSRFRKKLIRVPSSFRASVEKFLVQQQFYTCSEEPQDQPCVRLLPDVQLLSRSKTGV
jgi:hypothetical protein